MTNTFSTCSNWKASWRAVSRSDIGWSQPSTNFVSFLVSTKLSEPDKPPEGKDSNVLRPMMITFCFKGSSVCSLKDRKCFMSDCNFGQGNWLLKPMPPDGSTAAMMENVLFMSWCSTRLMFEVLTHNNSWSLNASWTTLA